MGNLKVGDDVIITEAIKLHPSEKTIVGCIAKIVKIDTFPYPYKVIYIGQYYWVDGIPYSSLAEELF